MSDQTILPINQQQREPIIDVLRGWALLGVVVVNYSLFYYLGGIDRIPSTDAISKITKIVTELVFVNKSRLLLNILFGFGFTVLMDKVQKKNLSVYPFFTKRMFYLLLIALLNSCLYYGDFLKDYCLMGMILLPFYAVSARTALGMAAVLLLVQPIIEGTLMSPIYSFLASNGLILPEPSIALYQSHDLLDVMLYGLISAWRETLSVGKFISPNLVVLACFFIGMYLRKANLVDHVTKNPCVVRRIFLASLGSMIAIGIAYLVQNAVAVDLFRYYNVDAWFNILHATLNASGVCWLYGSGKLKTLFESFQMIGRMTLTNYVMQNLIGLILFSGAGFGLLHKLSYSTYAAIAVAVYVSQVYLSKWWLRRFNFGPIEWLWRKLSYSRNIQLAK